MENIILVVHLILAICLMGVVLLQRSDGGGLGLGGGAGNHAGLIRRLFEGEADAGAGPRRR